MDYKNLTAPCGRDCFNCYFYLAKSDENLRITFAKRFNVEPEKVTCEGCRNIKGNCQILKNYGFNGKCKIFDCFKDKKIDFCFECNDFPCNLLHPLAHNAEKAPHNLKVFNLCKIKKLGLENWAANQAKNSFDRYFNDKLDTCV